MTVTSYIIRKRKSVHGYSNGFTDFSAPHEARTVKGAVLD